MASVFGDESADERRERVFAVAGVIGTDGQWDDLIGKWIERTGGKIFHATDCESEHANHSDGKKHKQNLRLYRDLTQLIENSEVSGWGVGIDLAGHREFFPNVLPDIPYYKCFVEVVKRIAGMAEEIGLSNLKFTFDHRQESEYNTGVLYDWMVNKPEWLGKNIFLETPINFDSSTNPRIQVADLVARETMKGLDSMIIGRKKRKSLIALARTNNRFRFDYLMRGYFEGWLSAMSELEKRAGFTRDDYAQWLNDNQLDDNISNRHRFGIWSEAQQLRLRDTIGI